MHFILMRHKIADRVDAVKICSELDCIMFLFRDTRGLRSARQFALLLIFVFLHTALLLIFIFLSTALLILFPLFIARTLLIFLPTILICRLFFRPTFFSSSWCAARLIAKLKCGKSVKKKGSIVSSRFL